MQERLVWESRALSELVRLGGPIAAATVSNSAMTFVNTLFVSWLGPASLAGLALGGVTFFFTACFSVGLLRSCRLAVSHAAGAGRREEGGRYLVAALLLAAVLSALTMAAGLLGAPLLAGLASTPAAGDTAVTYFRVRLIGFPLWLAAVAVRAACHGMGSARGPMLATLAGNLTNGVLSYVFVFTLEGGVSGAAWAANVGALVEAAALLPLQWRLVATSMSGVRPAHLRTLWRIGLPLGSQYVVEVGSFAVLTAMISSLSEVEMGAHQIAMQTLNLSFLPAFALSDAASVLVGQAVGARRDDLVHTVARHAVLTAGAYALLCASVLWLLGEQLAGWFTQDPHLAALTVRLFQVMALFQLFDAANVVARGVLRGTGDVTVPAMIGMALAWGCTPPMMWLLGYQAGWGVLGGWIGFCFEIAVGAALLWWRLRREHWRGAAERSRREQAVG